MSATTSFVAVMVGPKPEVREGPSMNARAIGSLAARAMRQKPDFQYSPWEPGALGRQDEQERLPAARLLAPARGPPRRGCRGRAGCRPGAAASQPSGPRKSSFLMSTRGPDVAAPHDEQHHHEVPVGRVRCPDEDAGARYLADGRPAGRPQHEPGEPAPHRVPSGWRRRGGAVGAQPTGVPLRPGRREDGALTNGSMPWATRSDGLPTCHHDGSSTSPGGSIAPCTGSTGGRVGLWRPRGRSGARCG